MPYRAHRGAGQPNEPWAEGCWAGAGLALGLAAGGGGWAPGGWLAFTPAALAAPSGPRLARVPVWGLAMGLGVWAARAPFLAAAGAWQVVATLAASVLVALVWGLMGRLAVPAAVAVPAALAAAEAALPGGLAMAAGQAEGAWTRQLAAPWGAPGLAAAMGLSAVAAATLLAAVKGGRWSAAAATVGLVALTGGVAAAWAALHLAAWRDHDRQLPPGARVAVVQVAGRGGGRGAAGAPEGEAARQCQEARAAGALWCLRGDADSLLGSSGQALDLATGPSLGDVRWGLAAAGDENADVAVARWPQPDCAQRRRRGAPPRWAMARLAAVAGQRHVVVAGPGHSGWVAPGGDLVEAATPCSRANLVVAPSRAHPAPRAPAPLAAAAAAAAAAGALAWLGRRPSRPPLSRRRRREAALPAAQPAPR